MLLGSLIEIIVIYLFFFVRKEEKYNVLVKFLDNN